MKQLLFSACFLSCALAQNSSVLILPGNTTSTASTTVTKATIENIAVDLTEQTLKLTYSVMEGGITYPRELDLNCITSAISNPKTENYPDSAIASLNGAVNRGIGTLTLHEHQSDLNWRCVNGVLVSNLSEFQKFSYNLPRTTSGVSFYGGRAWPIYLSSEQSEQQRKRSPNMAWGVTVPAVPRINGSEKSTTSITLNFFGPSMQHPNILSSMSTNEVIGKDKNEGLYLQQGKSLIPLQVAGDSSGMQKLHNTPAQRLYVFYYTNNRKDPAAWRKISVDIQRLQFWSAMSKLKK